MRPAIVYAKVKIVMDVEDNVSVDNVMCDMDYNFDFEGEEAEVQDTEIMEWYEI